jgi:hypothetical protein
MRVLRGPADLEKYTDTTCHPSNWNVHADLDSGCSVARHANSHKSRMRERRMGQQTWFYSDPVQKRLILLLDGFERQITARYGALILTHCHPRIYDTFAKLLGLVSSRVAFAFY